MALQPGFRVGPYEVLSALGAGGMGEVWRARDPRLGRDIALKVLPAAFVADPERLARFEREAKVLASLNHPHVGGIYGLGEADGGAVKALVLELVEGPTLADRIERGPIPIDEALPIARQIADALEAAHEQGIIHRDLKPANIKVRPDSAVKVLDFGLAKALEPQLAAARADFSHSPTLTLGAAATQMGLILGTAAYMAPEQARGEPADRRSDIWSFGVVLFEMLTGGRLFAAETVSETLAAVLRADIAWEKLPAETPHTVRTLLRRCLERDRRRRLQHIGDARLEIDESLAGVATEGERAASPLSPSRARTWGLLAVALFGALVAGALLQRWLSSAMDADLAPTSGQPTRVSLSLPEGFELEDTPGVWSPAFALSPDGTTLALVGEWNGRSQLFLRDLNGFDLEPVPGTEAATSPFFSPDGQWVGFHSEGKLKKVPRDGGAAVTICDAPLYRGTGVDWGPDDTIIFTWATFSGLYRVSASGGTPEPLTVLSAGDRSHAFPQFLPGGRSVLFNLWGTGAAAVLSLESGTWRTVLPGAHGSVYLPTGHLLFLEERGYRSAGPLSAVLFDLKRLEVVGAARPVLQNVHATPRSGRASFAVARTGHLAYLAAAPEKRWLAWVDREGKSRRITSKEAPYLNPRLSPDGRSVAFALDNLWTLDLERGTETLQTPDSFFPNNPAWAPDGQRLAYAGNRGAWNLFQLSVDSAGDADLLVESERSQFPESWSHDGTVLAFHERHPETGADLWLWSSDGGARPFLVTRFDEFHAQFSPDSRFIAYVSNESGREQVYVRPYPTGERRWTISIDGGTHPLWSRDGQELFYQKGAAILAVAIDRSNGFDPGATRTLFEGSYAQDLFRNYDVDLDGERFLMVEREAAPVTEVRLILDWFSELERLVPGE